MSWAITDIIDHQLLIVDTANIHLLKEGCHVNVYFLVGEYSPSVLGLEGLRLDFHIYFYNNFSDDILIKDMN